MCALLPEGYDTKREARGYAARDPFGNEIGFDKDADRAAQICTKHAAKKRLKMRVCISWDCSREFLSQGPGHRMCNVCRSQNSNYGMRI